MLCSMNMSTLIDMKQTIWHSIEKKVTKIDKIKFEKKNELFWPFAKFLTIVLCSKNDERNQIRLTKISEDIDY
jgi:hypothetical protein